MDRTIVIVGDIFLGGASAENAQSFLKDLDLDNSEALVCNLEQAISDHDHAAERADCGRERLV